MRVKDVKNWVVYMKLFSALIFWYKQTYGNYSCQTIYSFTFLTLAVNDGDSNPESEEPDREALGGVSTSTAALRSASFPTFVQFFGNIIKTNFDMWMRED